MALEGNLYDMSLEDLLHVFQSSAKSGVLLLVTNGQRGVIYVHAGRLVDALVVDERTHKLLSRADEAILAMLLWEAGRFVFRHDPATAERPATVTHQSEWLILESMHRRDASQPHKDGESLTMETRLSISAQPANAGSEVHLEIDQWRVLSQVSSCNCVGEICAHTPLSQEKVLQLLHELLAIGLIEVTPPEPERYHVPSHVASAPAAGITYADRPALPRLSAGASASAPAHPGLLGSILRRLRRL